MNRFGRALLSGRLLITAECLPPPGSDAGAFCALCGRLPSNLDGIVVSDNPDRIRASALSMAAMLRRIQTPSIILTMTTRDRNRFAMIGEILGAAALNIEAVFCIEGRHQFLGTASRSIAVHDLDSIQLVQILKRMALFGDGMDGEQLEPEIKLQIGAAAHPFMRPAGLNLLQLKKKVLAGADFLFTPPVFDLDGFKQWLHSIRCLGLDRHTAILPSVMPLASAERASELHKSGHCGPIGSGVISRLRAAANPAREGVVIAAETAKNLKSLPGIRGIHILCGDGECPASEVIRQMGA